MGVTESSSENLAKEIAAQKALYSLNKTPKKKTTPTTSKKRAKQRVVNKAVNSQK